jgi:hypothetical protein
LASRFDHNDYDYESTREYDAMMFENFKEVKAREHDSGESENSED